MGGDDRLTGLGDSDDLTGGTGADVFIYLDASDSPLSATLRDVIQDFEAADQIDLSAIDGDMTLGGMQGFTFIGRQTPNNSAAAGTLKYYHSGGNTFLLGGNDADGPADFQIQLIGIHDITTDQILGVDVAMITGDGQNETIVGSAGDDTLDGAGGDDVITGRAGRDMLTGGTGADRFVYQATSDSPLSATGRDNILDFSAADIIDLSAIDADETTAGHQGFTFSGRQAPNNSAVAGELKFFQSGGRTFLVAGTDADSPADLQIEIQGLHDLTTANLLGVAAANLTGGAGADMLLGSPGGDMLDGAGGADVLQGGAGRDMLTGGAAGDRFVYAATSDSPLSATLRDFILDYAAGDVIDLSMIDADETTAGHQSFTYFGRQPANNSAAAGILKYYQSGGDTYIVGGVDADAPADFQIQIDGLHALTPASFLGIGVVNETGGAGDDTLTGLENGDMLDGAGGDDVIDGAAGDDTLTGGPGQDMLSGGLGADSFRYAAASDSPLSASGRDVIQDFGPTDRIDLSAIDADETTAGHQGFRFFGLETPNNSADATVLRYYRSGGDTFIVGGVDGDGPADFQIQITGAPNLTPENFLGLSSVQLTGTAEDESLTGLDADDVLNGAGGRDILTGRGGRDILSGGSDGDRFVYEAVSDSPLSASGRDVITDFEAGDVIDLSAIDADETQAGLQGFSYIGRQSPDNTATPRELKYYQAGANTFIVGGVDGDAPADIQIEIQGLHDLTLDNFAGIDQVMLVGGDGVDMLSGFDQNDTLDGRGGSDVLRGNGGRDLLTGGAGVDQFVYAAPSDSPLSASGRDVILDYEPGDFFDLIQMDADETQAGHQGFTFTGQQAPNNSAEAGIVKFYHSGGNTFIVGGTDADPAADFQIQVNGEQPLTTEDFEGLANAEIVGTEEADVLVGTAGDDVLTGLGDGDALIGDSGADRYVYLAVNDSPVSAVSRDILLDFAMEDVIDLAAIDANETVAGNQGFTFLGEQPPGNLADAGALQYFFSGGDTFLVGGTDADATAEFQLQLNGIHNLTAAQIIGLSTVSQTGTAGADTLLGLDGNDVLNGAGGDDVLTGRGGRDMLQGGADDDRFVYEATTDSPLSGTGRDVIQDFAPGDLIDLSAIDADENTPGDQAFMFIGQQPVNNLAEPTVLKTYQTGGRTFVVGGTDNDAVADFQIEITGLHALSAGDFVL